MNAIKIFSENYVNGDCEYTYSSGDATGIYLYDQNQATKWVSSGSDDVTEETIEISFQNWQGESISRTFDRIILLGHNIKTGAFDYWNGSAWVNIPAADLADVSDSETLIELSSSITATKFRIRATETQTTDAEKQIGEIKVCLSIIGGSQLWRSDIPRTDDQKSGSYRVGDGGLVFWREWTKFSASGTLYDVDKDSYDLMFPLLKTGLLYTIIFWSDFDLKDCYEIAFTDPPRASLNRKTRLYEISLRMEEK